MTNGTPFTYQVQNSAFPLTAVNILFFKYELITNAERFVDYFAAMKRMC